MAFFGYASREDWGRVTEVDIRPGSFRTLRLEVVGAWADGRSFGDGTQNPLLAVAILRASGLAPGCRWTFGLRRDPASA